MRVVALVQARLGSTRLPGKVMRPVLGRPLIAYQLERIAQARSIDQWVVATTVEARDDPLVSFCQQQGFLCFRGSEDDVLKRFKEASDAFPSEVIVRLTGDCPLIDPAYIDRTVQAFLAAYPIYDYLSNTQPRVIPRGLDVEVFSRQALLKADQLALLPAEREHVTLTFYRHPELYQLGELAETPRDLDLRLTVDTPEDFELIQRILEALYPLNSTFSLDDISRLLQRHSDWKALNCFIEQKLIL